MFFAVIFQEDEDYDLIQSVNPRFQNALLGLNIFRDHPQAVRFVYPGDIENKLEQAEVVVIDEAASMPLQLLKNLLGPYIVLMTSTIERYKIYFTLLLIKLDENKLFLLKLFSTISFTAIYQIIKIIKCIIKQKHVSDLI